MIEIKKANNNYRFFLKTSQGNTLLNSVDFSTKAEAEKAVKLLNPLMEKQTVFERKTDHSGKFLFDLKDAKGNLIGKSQLYSSEAGMENGIKNLRNRIAILSKENSL